MERSGAAERTGGVAIWRATLLLAVISLAVGCSSRGMALHQVEWPDVAYPVPCPTGQPPAEQSVAYTTLESRGQVAVVLVQCAAEDGTGSAALLVYDKARSSTEVHLLQSLLKSSDGWVPGVRAVTHATRFLIVSPTSVELKVVGYTGLASRCCPTVFATLTWRWNGSTFHETSPEPAHTR